MGIPLSQTMTSFITNQTISSNNKLLTQYKTSIDLVLVETVEDVSLKLMHDLNNNFYLNCYFNNPLAGNLANIYDISKYLDNMSILNPLIFSLSIYYSNNNLLVSNDCIRHTLYKTLESQKYLNHYYNIVQQAAEISLNNEEYVSLIFDYGKNLNFKSSNVQEKKIPETVIHAVRITNGYNNIRGAVIVTVSGDIFKNFISKYAPEDLGSIYIFSKDGIIISHTDSTYIGHNISEFQYYNTLLQVNNESGYFISNVEGIPVVISYQTSSYNNWTYVSVAPMDNISSLTNYILRTIILIALLAMSVGIIISVAKAKKLAKPILSIADYCLKSPYSFSQEKNNNEYSLISGTLNNMENIMKEKEEEFKQVLPMLKMNFLSALFSDNPPEMLEIKSRMKMLGISFQYKFFCAAVITFDKLRNSEKVITYEYEKLLIQSQLENIFTTDSSLCLFYEKDNTMAVLFNFDFEDKVLYELGEKFLKQTLKQAYDNMSITKCISFGKIDTNIRNMCTSFKLALNGLNYNYVFPEKKIFTFARIMFWEEKHSFSARLLLNNFDNSLKCLDKGKCKSDLQKLVETLRNGNYSYQQIYNTLINCISIVEDFICAQIGEAIDLDQGFRNTANILEFESWMKGIIDATIDDLANIECSSTNLVKKAQAFIEQNIQNTQLSLEYIANELGVSAKHLSKIFKDKTGINYIDYLTNLKLSHCRNLLINTNLKVEEISDIMGYSTSQYFISRFKMMFGCTPKKYREKYSR